MQQAASCEIAAIASRDVGRAREAAQALGIPKACGSYEELLADPAIDAIYNPLPNHLHVPWSIRAAEAGKHVLCEKPIAMSADEARRLLEVRDRTGVLIQEAFMVRSHPQWIAARADRRVRAHRRASPARGPLQLLQRRPEEHPQRPRLGRWRPHGHRLLPRPRLADDLRPRAGSCRRHDGARSEDGHRSADLRDARFRRTAGHRHLQHAAGAVPAHPDHGHSRAHRDSHPLQRAARPTHSDSRRRRCRPGRRDG